MEQYEVIELILDAGRMEQYGEIQDEVILEWLRLEDYDKKCKVISKGMDFGTYGW